MTCAMGAAASREGTSTASLVSPARSLGLQQPCCARCGPLQVSSTSLAQRHPAQSAAEFYCTPGQCVTMCAAHCALATVLRHRHAPSGASGGHSSLGRCAAGHCQQLPAAKTAAQVHQFVSTRAAHCLQVALLRSRQPPSGKHSGLGIAAAGSLWLCRAARQVC